MMPSTYQVRFASSGLHDDDSGLLVADMADLIHTPSCTVVAAVEWDGSAWWVIDNDQVQVRPAGVLKAKGFGLWRSALTAMIPLIDEATGEGEQASIALAEPMNADDFGFGDPPHCTRQVTLTEPEAHTIAGLLGWAIANPNLVKLPPGVDPEGVHSWWRELETKLYGSCKTE